MLVCTHHRFHEIQKLLEGSDFIINPVMSTLDMSEDGQGSTNDLDACMKLVIPIKNSNHLRFELRIDVNFTLTYNTGPATREEDIPSHLVVVMYYLTLVDIDSEAQFVILSNTTIEYNSDRWPTADQLFDDVKEDICDKYPTCPF